MYTKIRNSVRWIASTFVGIGLVAILGQIAINGAVEVGWLSETPVADARASMSNIVEWPYWTQAIWFIAGVFFWSWLDWGLKKFFAPSLLRQLVDDQLFENAIEFLEIGPLRCVPADSPVAQLFSYAKIKNITNYGLYISLREPFFSMGGRVNQDFVIDRTPIFLAPNTEYTINIPAIPDVSISTSMAGRFMITFAYGLEETRIEREYHIDLEVEFSIRYENGNMFCSANSILRRDEFRRLENVKG